MFVLDTDTLTHYLFDKPVVVERVETASDEVVITVVTRIEVLQGRFAALLKAENGEKLNQASIRMIETESALGAFSELGIDDAVAAIFEQLRRNKKVAKIGSADLLIASITLANQATLVTRNLGDFKKVPGLKVENWMT